METDETQLSVEEKRKAQFKKQSDKRFSLNSLAALREPDVSEEAANENVKDEQDAAAVENASIETSKQASESKVKRTNKTNKSKSKSDDGFVPVLIRVPSDEYDQLFDLAIKESSETRKLCSPTKLIQSAYRSKYIKGAKK